MKININRTRLLDWAQTLELNKIQGYYKGWKWVKMSRLIDTKSTSACWFWIGKGDYEMGELVRIVVYNFHLNNGLPDKAIIENYLEYGRD
jgi:hypothetical protein